MDAGCLPQQVTVYMLQTRHVLCIIGVLLFTRSNGREGKEEREGGSRKREKKDEARNMKF